MPSSLHLLWVLFHRTSKEEGWKTFCWRTVCGRYLPWDGAACGERQYDVWWENDEFDKYLLRWWYSFTALFKSLQKIFQTIDKVYHIGLEWETESNRCTTTAAIEVTMECNPDDVTEEFALSLRSLPINRISMEHRPSPMNGYASYIVDIQLTRWRQLSSVYEASRSRTYQSTLCSGSPMRRLKNGRKI